MKRRNNATHRRDNSRWIVVGLTALALTGVGAMHTHVLMLRRGLDLLPAAAQAAGIILLAAIPIGYLVYRIWFAAPRPLLGGAVNSAYASDQDDWDELDSACFSGFGIGPQGCGYYSAGFRVDDDN